MCEYPVSIAAVCKMLLKAVIITTLLRRNGEVYKQAAQGSGGVPDIALRDMVLWVWWR